MTNYSLFVLFAFKNIVSGFSMQTMKPNLNFLLQSCDTQSHNLFDRLPGLGVPLFVFEKWLKFLTPTHPPNSIEAPNKRSRMQHNSKDKFSLTDVRNVSGLICMDPQLYEKETYCRAESSKIKEHDVTDAFSIDAGISVKVLDETELFIPYMWLCFRFI